MNFVSVIIPNYNHAQYLQQRIESVLNQTYQNFEIIILDDCSTDNSRDIIEQYRNHPKVSHIVYNQQNGGTSYKQWYKGIEFAKGDIIWIAESDDWCDYKLLDVLVPFFEDKTVSIAYSQTLYIYNNKFEKTDKNAITFEKYNGKDFIKDKMLGGNSLVNASSILFRKDFYEEVKHSGFVDLKLAGDWLLWIQIMNNHSIVSVNNQLNYCRRHSTNATGRFRAQGYDFTEGIKVMLSGQRICKNNFNRRTVYLSWLERYVIYKEHFSKGVIYKVDLNMLINKPDLFMFIKYKRLKTYIKALIFKK